MKIGLVTLYYNSANYGGLLQAYALEKYLNDVGYDATQISVAHEERNAKQDLDRSKAIILKIGISSLLKKVILKVYKKCNNFINDFLGRLFKANRAIAVRREAVRNFRESVIKHTETVFMPSTIEKCNDYDVYICGSDQIWRGITSYDNLNPAYWLTFVKPTKIKISYAASISLPSIPIGAEDKVARALESFNSISVREKSDKKNLERITKKQIEWVVDPTLLLKREQWATICATNPFKKMNMFLHICLVMIEHKEDGLNDSHEITI